MLSLFFYYLFLKIYLFLAVLGLRCCAWAFSSCGVLASHCAGFSCCGARALEHRLSSCGAQAQLLCGMWDPPGPGLEPCSLHGQADSQPLRHQGSPRVCCSLNFQILLTLEQHRFELCRSTHMQNFFNKYVLQHYKIQGWLNLHLQNWIHGALTVNFSVGFKKIFIFIGVQLFYYIVLVYTVQQSESAICIHISPLFLYVFRMNPFLCAYTA